MNSRNFTAKVNDQEIELSVISPSMKDQQEASKVYNNAFTEALKSKAVVRARLDDLLVDQGLWDEKKQQKFETLQREILEGERKLAKGGIGLTKAKEIALEMKQLRQNLRDLIAVKTNLDTHTAEGQADNAKFNFLVYACTVHKDSNKKYFSSYENYLERGNEEVAIKAAQNLANMIYGLDNDYEEKLPENKFLKDYKFVDDKLRLINKDGHLIDSDGRLVDENGRWIDKEGNFVDKFGNLLTEEGDYDVEFSPFLDDSGAPIVLEKTENTDKPEEQISSDNESKVD